MFPDSVGLDSGGARGGYESIENSITEAQKLCEIRIIDIDASIEAFKNKFQYLYPQYFEPHKEESLYEILNRMKGDNVQLTEFLKEAQRIDEAIKKQEYMSAFRDMRAMIEGLLKHICKIKGIEVKGKGDKPDKPKIAQYSNALKENNIYRSSYYELVRGI